MSEILDYWNNPQNESMYDKHLLNAEIALIKSYLKPGAKILDAGCGEGEGTREYSKLAGSVIHACDFSFTRIEKAMATCCNINNIIFKQMDFTDVMQYSKLDIDYDFIISQRFLINIVDAEKQKYIINRLLCRLKKGGQLLMLEGSIQGVNQLNAFRSLFGLDPIPVKWHNLFFDDDKLSALFYFLLCEKYISRYEKTGLGTYFLLTRGIRPIFESNLNWESEFNRKAAMAETDDILDLRDKCSRLKLWVVTK